MVLITTTIQALHTDVVSGVLWRLPHIIGMTIHSNNYKCKAITDVTYY